MKMALLPLSVMFSTFVVMAQNAEQSTAAVGPVDMAVDGLHNIVYVQKSENNPGGTVFKVDAKSGSTVGELNLSTISMSKDAYEIELGEKGVIYFLVKGQSKTRLGAVIPNEENFSKSKVVYFPSNMTNDLKQVHALTTELSGQVSLEGHDIVKGESVVKVFDVALDDQGVPTLTESGKISAEKFTAQVEALKNEAKPEYPVEGIGVGFTAGWLSGLGFMYRQFFSNSWGFHVGAGAFKNNDQTFVNVGLQALRVINMGRISRLYALAGAGIYINRNRVYDYSQPPVKDGEPIPPYEPTSRMENSYTYNLGLGLGMEFGTRKGITASLEVPIVASFQKTGNGATSLDKIAPLPSFSLIYYIK